MTSSLRRWFRPLCPFFLAGCIAISPVATISVRAQAPATPAEGESEESKGRPLDGYLLMVMLSALAFMVIGKTARR